MNPQIPYYLEPNEQVIAEYRIKNLHGSNTNTADGFLSVTTKRILLFQKKSLLQKLVKLDGISYEQSSSFDLKQILKISQGGMFDKYIEINGRRFFLEGVNTKTVLALIKNAIEMLEEKSTQTMIETPKNIYQENIELHPPDRIFCPYCQNENPINAKFCMSCGSELKRN